MCMCACARANVFGYTYLCEGEVLFGGLPRRYQRMWAKYTGQNLHVGNNDAPTRWRLLFMLCVLAVVPVLRMVVSGSSGGCARAWFTCVCVSLVVAAAVMEALSGGGNCGCC